MALQRIFLVLCLLAGCADPSPHAGSTTATTTETPPPAKPVVVEGLTMLPYQDRVHLSSSSRLEFVDSCLGSASRRSPKFTFCTCQTDAWSLYLSRTDWSELVILYLETEVPNRNTTLKAWGEKNGKIQKIFHACNDNALNPPMSEF